MATGRISMFTVDTAEPGAAATFWSEVLGWPIQHSEGDYAMIGDGGTAVGFGRIDGYVPPAWPDVQAPKRFHFDVAVTDVSAAEARCLELGATKPEFQPGDGKWTVLLDPSGHPFCIFPEA